MQEILMVKSFQELHEIFFSPISKQALYRGVTDAENHILLPSIGRISHKSRGRSGFPSYEKRLLTMFKDLSREYLNKIPDNEIEWIALSQHHGLPTRLLDWSYNPLVAAFFAVEKEYDGDSAIYIYRTNKTVSSTDIINPFSISEVKKYRSPCFDERIRVQKSVFTIHPKPQTEFCDSKNISKIIIANEFRTFLKKILGRYGISRETLFPGLDGISKGIINQISSLHEN